LDLALLLKRFDILFDRQICRDRLDLPHNDAAEEDDTNATAVQVRLGGDQVALPYVVDT
jgi:hypothetical protein